MSMNMEEIIKEVVTKLEKNITKVPSQTICTKVSDEEKGQVICFECEFAEDGLCLTKKSKVHLNKKRQCKHFKYNDKPRTKNLPEYLNIPIELRDKKTRTKLLKQEVNKLINTKVAMEQNKYLIPSTNTANPLTGDLTRFMTTANLTT